MQPHAPQYPSTNAPAFPRGAERVVKEKLAASADTDQSTAQTVAKMCEYIHKSAGDPVVQRWARAACDRLALGNTSPSSLCWGVWWMAKHRVRFAKDEPRLMGTGDGDALDLLIEPAVLVRQLQPAEDCDGFTMLVCAMLECLGVPWNIVTIACDPSDRTRWSHVFPVAVLGTEILPLDASHGDYPGWMVPAEHITRWQCWDERGRKVNRPDPRRRRHTLHGYTRGRGSNAMRSMRRGMGQDDDSIDFDGGDTDAGSGFDWSTTSDNPGGGTQLFTTPTNTALPSSSSGLNLANLIASITGQAAKVATVAELPAGSTLLPNGTILGSGANPLLTSSIASYLPLLLIAGVGIFALSALGGKR